MRRFQLVRRHMDRWSRVHLRESVEHWRGMASMEQEEGRKVTLWITIAVARASLRRVR